MFHFTLPTFPLRPFIENIWYCNRYIPTEETTKTLPLGRMEMVIRFSGTYHITHKETDFHGKEFWIIGQQTKPTTSIISGQHECMGVVFTPLGWNAFSNIPSFNFINRSIELEDVFGAQIYALKNELKEAYLPEIKCRKLQDFLLKRLSGCTRLSTILKTLAIIDETGHCEKVTVNYLCRHLKISRKSLNSHFRSYIGLPATSYLQQRVLNRVIKDLSSVTNARLIETGYDHHFFDQAHFIKQFRGFSGLTPGEYLQLVKTNAVDTAFPNFINF